MTKRRLPPHKGLVALEAVVRLGTVTGAASELSVTHSAVSKQLTLLSEWLGRPLFEDNRKQMIPTPAARRLATVTSQALDLLAAGVQEAAGYQEAVELKVAAPSTFAMWWLLPRLVDFQAETPDVAVTVLQTHTGERWWELPCDVAIHADAPHSPRFETERLYVEELQLVVAPTQAHDLKLIAADTRPGELEAFLRAISSPELARLPVLRFPHFYLAFEAALSGRGAVVAPEKVASESLRKGQLVELAPGTRVQGRQYHLSIDRISKTRANAKRFGEWIATAVANY